MRNFGTTGQMKWATSMRRHNPRIMRTVMINIAKNAVYSIPGAEAFRSRVLGSPFAASSADDSESWSQRRCAQVKQILRAYLNVWGDVDWFQDKVVVELGSGQDISIPFCFAVLGASKAYATDVPSIDSISLSNELRLGVTSVISEVAPHQIVIQPDRAEKVVARKSHVFAERLESAFSPESVDLIVSTSALEHVEEPVAAAAQMFRVLSRGGRMIHAIAIGNHCCGEGEQDRLGHLYYSDRMWALMFSRRVGHNRLQWFEWKRVLEDAGFDIRDHQLTIVPSAEIAQCRPSLASRFAKMSDEQLGPSYAVVSCQKKS